MTNIELDVLRRRFRPPAALIERGLSVLATLGLACLCIGLILHAAGRASNNLTVARIGAYVLVVGVVFIIPRILYWIAVEIVE